MSKKVIEQKNDIDIIVDPDHAEGRVYVASLIGPAYIEKENATTVAKAICPEYQKVIDELEFLRAEHPVNIAIRNENKTLKDQNAKLVEALREIKSIGGFDSTGKIGRAINQALQNNKKIEG